MQFYGNYTGVVLKSHTDIYHVTSGVG